MDYLLPTNPDLTYQAVQRCCQAWFHVRDEKPADPNIDFDDDKNREKAAQAFRNEMPLLVHEQEIHDYIACVSQGMLLGAIEPLDGSRFLYAAQIALLSLRNASRAGREPRRPRFIDVVKVGEQKENE